MNTLVESIQSAKYADGHVTVVLGSGVEIRFPILGNPRLEGAPAQALTNIECSPFGIHWPELDEDLSLEGIARGDFGQHQKRPA